MSWTTYNNRKEALREVLAIADRRREEGTATKLLASVESARTAFTDEADLLLDVQMFWRQALSGQLDRALTYGADSPEQLAIEAWRTVAGQLPGARALLDTDLDRPELAVAMAKEHEMMARSAGIAWNHPQLLSHGRRIVDAARFRVPVAA